MVKKWEENRISEHVLFWLRRCLANVLSDKYARNLFENFIAIGKFAHGIEALE